MKEIFESLFLMFTVWRYVKEKTTSKLLEFEAKVEGFFKKDFIGLRDACAVFGKDLKENESLNGCSFSLQDDVLKKYFDAGYCVVTVPRGITVGDICSTNQFVINLSPLEIAKLKREVIRPGYIFVRKEPRNISFGEMNMRDLGLKVQKDPKLAEVMYAYALSHLIGKRKMLMQRICVLCQDEVVRRGVTMPVCIKKNAGTAIEIGAWRSLLRPLNVLGIDRVC